MTYVFRLGSCFCFLGALLFVFVGCESSAPTKDEQTAEQEKAEDTQQAENEQQKQQAESQNQVAENNNEGVVPANNSSDEIVLSEEEKNELGIDTPDDLENAENQPVNNDSVIGEDQLANNDSAIGEDQLANDGVVDNNVVPSELDPEEKLKLFEKKQDNLSAQTQSFVQHLVQTAKKKMAENKYQRAKLHLQEAINLDPTHAEANREYNKVARILGDRERSIEGITKTYEDQVKIKEEQARLEARNNYKKGLTYLGKKEYDKAIDSFQSSLEIIKYAPYQLNLDHLRRQAEARIQQAQDGKEKWLAKLREEKMLEAQREAERLEREEQERRITQIQILLSRATDFYTQKKYHQSEELVGEVLGLDPTNKTAKKLKKDILDARHSHISETTVARKIDEWKNWRESFDASTVPYSTDIQYPDAERWHNVISKRADASSSSQITAKNVSPEEQEILSKLESTRITLNFNETPFQDVIRFIAANSGINIVVHDKVIQTFQIEGTKVTLNVNNLKLKTALNILLQFHNLTYVFRHGVLFITTKDDPDARGKVVAQLHDIRDLTGQIKDFPGPKIRLLAADGEEAGTAVFQEQDEAGGPVLTEEKLTELIRASISPDSWEKDENSIATTSGQLLVVNTQEAQAEIHSFLKDLRRFSGMMVAIEARFLTVTDDFLESLGVDWRGIGDNNTALDRALLPAVSTDFEDFAGGLQDNTNGGQQLVDADGDVIVTPPAAGFFFRDESGGPLGGLDARARTENIDDQALGTRLNETGGLSLSFAHLDSIQLNAVLRAVKKTAQAEVMTAPRLTTFNTQRANLTVVRQRSYVKDFDVEVAQSAYIADPVIGVVQDGVVMDVRPTISNDRRYITLELRPTVAVLADLVDFTTFLGGQINVTFQQPELELQSVETSVKVPDRGTILIGGLRDFRQEDRKQDVPVLGDIPVIGFFFSQRKKLEERNSLIILVTAKIIDLQEEEERAVGTPK